MSTTWLILASVTWAVIVLLVVMMLGLARQLADLHMALRSLTSAAPSPAVPSTEFVPGGELPELRDFTRVPRPTLFLFLSSACAPCQELAMDLKASGRDWTRRPSGGELETVLVTDSQGAAKYEELAVDQVLLQREGDIAKALGVSVTPYGVVADASGTLRAGRVVNSLSDVRTLVTAIQVPLPQQQVLVASS